MAFTNLVAAATTRKDGVVSTGIETAVNNQLAGVLNRNIVGVGIVARDKARKQGKELSVQVSHDDTTGDTTLTNPYRLITFIGATLAEASNAAANWRAGAGAGFFHAVPFFRYINQLGPTNKPFIIFQFYSEDAVGGPQNWKVGNPLVLDTSAFNRALSAADNTVQRALNTIDDDVNYVIHRNTLATAVQTYDISGISLSACQLLFNLKNDNVGGATLSVFVNGDYTVNRYHRNNILCANGANPPSGGEGTNSILEIVGSGWSLMGKIIFMVGPDRMLMEVFTSLYADPGNQTTRIQTMVYTFANLAAITDIRLSSNVADGIGAGTQIRLLNLG